MTEILGNDFELVHRNCPGKNVGTKADWIAMLEAAMAGLHPGDCKCADHAKAKAVA